MVIDVTGKGAPRRFGDQVKLFVEGSQQPAATIFVAGRLVGDVSVTPEVLYWGIQDPEHWPGSYPETMTTRRISITAAQNVKSLEVTNPIEQPERSELGIGSWRERQIVHFDCQAGGIAERIYARHDQLRYQRSE